MLLENRFCMEQDASPARFNPWTMLRYPIRYRDYLAEILGDILSSFLLSDPGFVNLEKIVSFYQVVIKYNLFLFFLIDMVAIFLSNSCH